MGGAESSPAAGVRAGGACGAAPGSGPVVGALTTEKPWPRGSSLWHFAPVSQPSSLEAVLLHAMPCRWEAVGSVAITCPAPACVGNLRGRRVLPAQSPIVSCRLSCSSVAS